MTVGLLVRAYTDKGWRIVTAESCTGGLVAGAITEVAGSSVVFERGFVTYSNASKTELLGVSAAMITTHGAVSETVARAMAEGALARSHADVAIAITGVAGPGGGSAEKPIGLVHFACATKQNTLHLECQFGNVGRAVVRQAAVRQALNLLLQALS